MARLPQSPTAAARFFRDHAMADNIAALFDHLPRVYLFVKDRQHRLVKVNRGFLLLHGFASEADVLGKTDHDFHPPALASQYVEEDQHVMKSRHALPDRVWLVRGADGMPRWYYSTKLPLLNRRGAVIGVAGVMRPYEQAGDAPGDYHRLTPVCEYVLAHFAQPITVGDLARRAHFSVSQLQREFQRLFGMAPSEYLLRVRLLMARRALEQSAAPAGQIALDCGFYDQSHFNRAFRAATGLRPLDYRRRFAPRIAQQPA